MISSLWLERPNCPLRSLLPKGNCYTLYPFPSFLTVNPTAPICSGTYNSPQVINSWPKQEAAGLSPQPALKDPSWRQLLHRFTCLKISPTCSLLPYFAVAITTLLWPFKSMPLCKAKARIPLSNAQVPSAIWEALRQPGHLHRNSRYDAGPKADWHSTRVANGCQAGYSIRAKTTPDANDETTKFSPYCSTSLFPVTNEDTQKGHSYWSSVLITHFTSFFVLLMLA